MTDSDEASQAATTAALDDKGDRLAAVLGLDDGDKGTVGIGSDRLFVYVRGTWRGEKMASFEGVPVEWREKTGTARALAD